MEYSFFPGGVQFENNAIVPDTSILCGSVQVAGRVLDNARVGIAAIRAVCKSAHDRFFWLRWAETVAADAARQTNIKNRLERIIPLLSSPLGFRLYQAS